MTAKLAQIGVWGGHGKMGQQVVQSLRRLKPKVIVVVPRRNHLEELQSVDVVIDFSTAMGLSTFLAGAKNWSKKPKLVSGSTGLSKTQLGLLNRYASETPTLWSANFSPGVWILRHALQGVAEQCQRFNFERRIREIHHVHKKDSPSGTALAIQQDFKELRLKPCEIESLRMGEVVGVHQVILETFQEKLTFEHSALDRGVFAEGAVAGALWLLKQKKRQAKGQNNFYTMDDFMKPVAAKKDKTV